ncbi:MAG: tetratricopeptide repeat protein [Gemmataceae bacterium]
MILPTLLLAAFAAAPPPAKAPSGMPATKLKKATLVPGMCLVHYGVSTTSPACQAYVDQALGYYYSYVWMEAARSFETALSHDPNCAFAHWGLGRSLERWGRGTANDHLKRAWELRDNANPREAALLKAAMQEKGLLPDVGDAEKRKQAAINTLDELLAQHDDDEEAWYYRAQLGGGSGLFGGKAASVPFYKALLKVNPLHPGANHELLHFYENFKRPALGWTYAENYIRSSPGVPHAFHMQAHLATRLGRWKLTSDRSARAIEIQREYHRRDGVKPTEDQQYQHHLETLLTSLTHDGRFAEGRAIKKECQANNFNLREPFVRLHLAERDFAAAGEVIDQIARGGQGGRRGGGKGGDKTAAAYYAALMHLKQNEPGRALPHVEVLQQAARAGRADKRLEGRLMEAQGLYLCLTGDGAAGLKLLAKVVGRTKDDYGHHAWGNGAYYMEAWGVAALAVNKLDAAEEAFHEALAHDPGSVRAALGMQVVCERLGRSEEVERFAALARRCWGRADAGHLAAELAALRGNAAARPDPTKQAAGLR